MPQNTNTNEVRATAKYVRVAPRKARAVVSLIRDLPVEKALEVLQFSTRAASVDVAKVLRSAIANAENNNGLRGDNLYVKLAYVDEFSRLASVSASPRSGVPAGTPIRTTPRTSATISPSAPTSRSASPRPPSPASTSSAPATRSRSRSTPAVPAS